MQIFQVGGAVRDRLLGRPVNDHDWVVVGATPEQMVARGFRPVGKDFPVFLHPATHEEYALARTERKNGRGYKGFAVYAAPEVTLEEDLARRDLTINAIALDAQERAIDPFGGQADLHNKVLRHVSPAFAEDPVRILRLARFAARFTDFSVAPETLSLCQTMVQEGEVDHLVAERVWQELATGLMEAAPARMLTVLRDCGALKRLAPELDACWGVPQPLEHHPEGDTGAHLELVLTHTATHRLPLTVRFAALVHDLGKALTPPHVLPRHMGHDRAGLQPLAALCERWKVPTDCKELARLACAEHIHVHQSLGFGAEAVQRLLQRCDALRRPGRFAELMQVCEADARGRLGLQDRPYPQAERLLLALDAALAVDTAAVTAPLLAAGASGPTLGRAVDLARREAITMALSPGR
ncbi:multifunctional CCA addition/repair protein [Inhella gelatinilytica]|uniref:Multifunctional CCA protein n=1 Tax=Inhella gelatinilytica TaxID=2795030 RepID=A0A931NAA4_9BURK|nr:multifunctional CCA addition/repair protein [Inhella gelatinilytica]MBH9552258.1 multifunctional CCA addition/repair protein [Inhella gelatinilytica]